MAALAAATRLAFAVVLCAVAVTCLPLVDIEQEQGALVLVDDDSRLLSPGAPSADASLGSSQESIPSSSTKKVHGGIKLAIKVPKFKGLPTAAQYKTLGNAAHPYGVDKGEERIEKELKVAEDVHKSSKFMKHAMAHGTPLQTASAKWPAGKPKFTHKSKPSLGSGQGSAPENKAAWPLGGLQFKQPDRKFHDPIKQEDETPDLGESEDISENPHENSKGMHPKKAESTTQQRRSDHGDEGEDNDQDGEDHQDNERGKKEPRQHGRRSRHEEADQSEEELGEQRDEDHGSNSRSTGEDDTSDESGLQDMLRANGLRTVPSAHWVAVQQQQASSNKPSQEREEDDHPTELGESVMTQGEESDRTHTNKQDEKQEDNDARALGEAAEQEEGEDASQGDLGESSTISTSQHREEAEHSGEAPMQKAAPQTSPDNMGSMFGNDGDGADEP